MKNSTNVLQQQLSKEEECSESKCATCFENRGCIYEQYLGALIRDMEKKYLVSRIANDTER